MSELKAECVKQAKRDRSEYNELLDAIRLQNIALVDQKLATGSNPSAYADVKYARGKMDMEDGDSALCVALKTGNMVIVNMLLKAGADVNFAMGDRVTVLMMAVMNNKVGAARLLLEWGAKLNALNNLGKTALICAVEHRLAAMTQLLVDSGADLNVKDVNGGTALHWASLLGDIESTRVLLDADVAGDVDDKEGNTPAKVALLNKNFAILELLLRYGASAHRAAVLPKFNGVAWTEEEKNHIGKILGAFNEQPSFVHLLADHGGICEKEELDYHMSGNGHTQVVRALRQVGCDAWCGGGRGLNMLRKTTASMARRSSAQSSSATRSRSASATRSSPRRTPH